MISPAVHAFCLELGERYNQLMPWLPLGSGHCNEVAHLAIEVAEDHGLPAQLHLGPARMRDCVYPSLHAWAEVAGVMIHSPEPGVIEVEL